VSNWRDYEDMPREQLIERLRAAEDACVYMGWTAVIGGSDRNDAATELWHRWARLPSVDTSVDANAELAAAERALAETRRETRERVISYFFGDQSEER
jgi:hypothetical protein